MIDAVASKYGLHEVIQETMHLLDSLSSYLLTKFNAWNWKSLLNTSKLPLWDNFHKIWFIYFLSVNLQINCLVLWNADSELIQRAANQFDWLRVLSNDNVEKKVFCFIKYYLI